MTRTAKSVKNAKVVLSFYFINLVLQFFSRKIFLEYLGAEVLGLNTTVQNLIDFLNLAELGIGAAVAYNLYKSLFGKNKQAINEIISVQGWLFLVDICQCTDFFVVHLRLFYCLVGRCFAQLLCQLSSDSVDSRLKVI